MMTGAANQKDQPSCVHVFALAGMPPGSTARGEQPEASLCLSCRRQFLPIANVVETIQV